MRLTTQDRDRYREQGYLILPGLFSPTEVQALLQELDAPFVRERAYPTHDAAGGASRFAIWYELRSDLWGAASMAPRILDPLAFLWEEAPAFYHGKVIFKEPGAGASWEWHQDYGYWYHSFLQPRLASVWVALDPASSANGCLQVLPGSHRLGRLDHIQRGDQMGIEPRRLAAVQERFPAIDCEVAPGSAILFDSLLVHGSRPNRSDRPRRSFIMCYCAASTEELVPDRPALRRPPCPRGPAGELLADGALVTPS